ncbi:SH3 domain-containing protein [Chloroflexales bacterium ZM16-3]|nr:SH3 domain-containing protein [Chloroflexales bacterium ZM16-3]
MHIISRVVILGMISVLLTACGGVVQSGPPEPTATEAPTATMPPPTPTATPDPATILSRAIAATEALDSYRMRFSLQPFVRKLPGANGHLLDAQPFEYILVHDGAKIHLIGDGDLLHIPGVTWKWMTPIELIHADGVIYAHGPLPLPGAADQVWYSLGDDPPEGFTIVPPDGAELLRRMTDAIDLEAFIANGQEGGDGEPCDVYRAETAAALAALHALGIPLADPTPGSAAIQFSLCDGYVYQMVIASSRQPSDISGVRPDIQINLVFANYGQARITPPAQSFTPPYLHEASTIAVWHGGNVRATPVSGEPRDQAHAGEQLLLYARTADNGWYLVVTPRGRAGWISATLVTLDQDQAAIPVDNGLSTLAQGLPPVPYPTAERAGAIVPPTPPAAPLVTPSAQEFRSGRFQITVPLSYGGGIIATEKAQMVAEMRALGGPFADSAEQLKAIGDGLAMFLYDRTLGANNFVTNIVVIRDPQPLSGTLDQYIDQNLSALPATVKIRSRGTITPYDTQVGSIETELAIGDRSVYQWMLIYPSHEDVWIVTLSTDLTEFNTRIDELREIVDSVFVAY